MEIKMSGKSLSELQWMHNEIQPLLEAHKTWKPKITRDLTGKSNKTNLIKFEN